jgi:hypothetical protein
MKALLDKAKQLFACNTVNPNSVVKIERLADCPCFIDRDVVMFHAMFQILVDFVEKEQPNGIQAFSSKQQNLEHIAWLLENDSNGTFSDSARQYQSAVEIIDLYDWYKNVHPQLEQRLQSHDSYESLYAEEQQMLVRLINIRSHLWT